MEERVQGLDGNRFEAGDNQVGVCLATEIFRCEGGGKGDAFHPCALGGLDADE
jgi:hypothetical protein